MKERIGLQNIVLITLDSLRYDVAQKAFLEGKLKTLGSYLPSSGWEKRHSPASFTYAAHHAFFSGFLPTPAIPGKHPRLFATAFQGSETTSSSTAVFAEATFVEGLRNRKYRTFCIGGVGFFNQKTSLGCVLPSLFEEAYWSEEMGVTNPFSTSIQIQKALELLQQIKNELFFLFINISAIHQPNYFYKEKERVAHKDTTESHQLALEYVDRELQPLFSFLQQQGNIFCILCSDHGTAYGEEGFEGHRIGHEVVWNVPYTDFEI